MLRGWSEITRILTYRQMYPQSMFLIATDMLQCCAGKKCLSPLYCCIQYMGYWVVQLQYWWQCQAKSVVILWYRIMITWHEQQEWMLVSVSDGTQGITVSYDIVFHVFSSAQNHERYRSIRSVLYIYDGMSMDGRLAGIRKHLSRDFRRQVVHARYIVFEL